ncbi:hypothetical protein SAM23877_6137 [Streptomyces ambofaciens ATCC 23877]|uniref:Uncharacterized protein n=1 Tax=Streptomyces ambofaciens (strain ATCC 23877 / 3486 / DSM 40053 / JCM 4204 / NBRC 12836 / NRRL B-2516) TaxID=278992 RepID=A0A0K2B267_STRA7|nr:hypothetical protein [Streptomyces ambofaciens]AKZ59182.1 hypothetical protein SAM23877_6137 [Streptomyces ambofaciens ATCC 23877]WNA15375.1 hypothetical protein SAMYPH_44 [Streptomyces phage Samy]
MTYTLADAIRDEFERTHPNGKNTLLCVGLCRRRKDRNDFRETPWHGRAARCTSCEGLRYVDELRYRQAWELEQERAKVRMLVRHIQRLRLQRIVERAPALHFLTEPMPEAERRRKRARLTLQMERKR